MAWPRPSLIDLNSSRSMSKQAKRDPRSAAKASTCRSSSSWKARWFPQPGERVKQRIGQGSLVGDGELRAGAGQGRDHQPEEGPPTPTKRRRGGRRQQRAQPVIDGTASGEDAVPDQDPRRSRWPTGRSPAGSRGRAATRARRHGPLPADARVFAHASTPPARPLDVCGKVWHITVWFGTSRKVPPRRARPPAPPASPAANHRLV